MDAFEEDTKCRVLVVEDDYPQRSLFTEILDEKHVSVVGVVSAAEALDVLYTAGHVDLLVADIQLSGRMNGFELAEHCRRIQPDLRVLFVTGHHRDTAYLQRCADPDAEIMFKPFMLSEFALKVSSMLADLPCHKSWMSYSKARGWAS
ncbi:MAG: response regulator [Proteobacteria bacterium]|nr:MAG: response regulator [Pseudomonadota bacterium]